MASIKTWSTDRLVAIGLVAMGLLSVVGYIVRSIITGESNGTEIPMAIVSGLTGYLGRGVVDKHQEGEKK